jgi:uncharacterized membrane protein
MNNRIWFAILGIALTVVSAALLGFGKSSMTVQVCLALGMAIGFLAIGLEHFYDSPFLDKFTSRRTKAVRGIVLVVIGIGLLLLTVRNLLRMIH